MLDPQGYKMTNVTQPGKLWTFVCTPVNSSEPWYIAERWIIAVIVVGVTAVVLALLFLIFYRKGARPAFMQQYFNMRKRLLVRAGNPRGPCFRTWCALEC